MKGIRRKVFFVLKIIVSTILVYLVIEKTGLDGIADSLYTIGPNLFVALACSLLFTFLKVLKWHSLVIAASSEATTLMDAAKSYFVGMAGGLLTPGRVGEIARAVYLDKHKRSLIVYLVAVDRIFEIAAVVLLAMPGLFYYADVLVVAVAAILLAIMLAVVYYPEFPLRWLQRFLPRAGKFAVVQKQLALMVLQLKNVSTGIKIKQMGLALISYMVVILQFHYLLNNYHHSRLWTAIITQPLIMLTNVLPLTIGGLGIREGTAMVLLSSFNVPRAASIASAFMLFFLNTALPAFVGIIVFIFFRYNKSDEN